MIIMPPKKKLKTTKINGKKKATNYIYISSRTRAVVIDNFYKRINALFFIVKIYFGEAGIFYLNYLLFFIPHPF